MLSCNSRKFQRFLRALCLNSILVQNLCIFRLDITRQRIRSVLAAILIGTDICNSCDYLERIG